MKRLLPLTAFLIAASAFAQIVSIGSVAGIEANSSLGATTIDMSHPASASGQVTTAWIRWTGPTTCTASMQLKVLRLDVVSGNFTVVGDRPLTVSAGANKVLLGIPINVQAGDLIATVADGTCGAVAATRARYGDFSLVTSGDIVTGRNITSFNMDRDTRPLVQLTNSDPLLSGATARESSSSTSGSRLSKRRARSFNSQRMCWLANAKNWRTFCGNCERPSSGMIRG